MTIGTLTWARALDHLDLVAPSTAAALTAWAEHEPRVAHEVLVAQIDPELADTAALTEAFELPPSASVNCVLVAGRREGTERVAAALVRATTRADVNSTVKRLLDVRKCSFLPMDRATVESGMEYGGITPIGLPDDYRLLLDARVTVDDPDAGGLVVIGSGVRHSKIALPGALLAAMPGVEVVDGLAIG
ncbi:YbaK/EbsC family protein [Cellulomonas edaphi]|uniref:YbaK/EbsC family protein n=1 Tax=Cellulomonas edaphi TaxID=3053468 RepID=A0ABT7S5T1_9CELL|nr:YbaK/EbsC family protein [Cellulomons edaphi]MDM7830973.1 YbaK/EbsC family protein [Cellulomons edaphi]